MTMPTTNSLSKITRRDVMPDGSVCFTAEYSELPGCVVYSHDEAEADRMLEEAKVAYLAHLTANNLPLPELPDVVDDKPRFYSSRDERPANGTWNVLSSGQWPVFPSTA